MIIFLDARGNIVTPPVPEPIGRGSNDANTIYIVAPLSSSANIYMTFTLPNGEALFGGLAENVRSSSQQADSLQASYLFTLPDSELSVWKYLVKSTVTRLSGVVQYTVVTVTSSMRATSPGTFTVSKGGRIKLPEDPTPSAWDEILAQVGYKNEELEFLISVIFGEEEGYEGLVSKVESVERKSERNEKNINYASEKISAIRESVPCVSLHMEDTPLSVVLDEASTYLGGPPQAIVSGRALYNLAQDGVTAKKSTMIPPFSRVVFDLEKRQGTAYLQNRTVLFDIVGSYEGNTIRVLSDASVDDVRKKQDNIGFVVVNNEICMIIQEDE